MPAATPADAVHYREANTDHARVFYREAGDRKNPAVVLLHGFPSSSHMYRDLIPRLSDRFHVLAPDLPGFGFTTVADAYARQRMTFAFLAQTLAQFLDAISLEHYALYVFDYGAPVGFRLATARPNAITAIISQNGNAYLEGLSEGWNPIQAYWKDPSEKNRDALRAFLTPEATKWQYTHGVPDPTRIAPESYTLDALLMARPGNAEIQLDLFLDYASNVELYPVFQRYFRDRRPPLLAAWGKGDPFFLPPGAQAYRRDLPDAEIHLLDTGHFALETHAAQIAELSSDFLSRKISPQSSPSDAIDLTR